MHAEAPDKLVLLGPREYMAAYCAVLYAGEEFDTVRETLRTSAVPDGVYGLRTVVEGPAAEATSRLIHLFATLNSADFPTPDFIAEAHNAERAQMRRNALHMSDACAEMILRYADDPFLANIPAAPTAMPDLARQMQRRKVIGWFRRSKRRVISVD